MQVFCLLHHICRICSKISETSCEQSTPALVSKIFPLLLHFHQLFCRPAMINYHWCMAVSGCQPNSAPFIPRIKLVSVILNLSGWLQLRYHDSNSLLQTCLVQRFFRPFYSGILIGQYARNNTLPSPPLPSFSRILYIIFYVTSSACLVEACVAAG